MLLRTGDVPAALRPDREPTRRKMVRKWLADKSPEPSVIPALDIAALNRKYRANGSQEYAPKLHWMECKVPKGWNDDQVRVSLARDSVKFIEAYGRQGWDIVTSRRPVVHIGPSDYYDVVKKAFDPDFATYRIGYWFRCRSPKVIRTELRPEQLGPITV